jgi:hypothetical protein
MSDSWLENATIIWTKIISHRTGDILPIRDQRSYDNLNQNHTSQNWILYDWFVIGECYMNPNHISQNRTGYIWVICDRKMLRQLEPKSHLTEQEINEWFVLAECYDNLNQNHTSQNWIYMIDSCSQNAATWTKIIFHRTEYIWVIRARRIIQCYNNLSHRTGK